MDLNEILTKERDSLRDENIELRQRINELEISLQKAMNLLESDDWKISFHLYLICIENQFVE